MNLHEWMQAQPSEADGGPCREARAWVEANRHLSLEQMGASVVDHPMGLGWLWWFARYMDVPLVALAREHTLRSLRIHTPAALERVGLHEWAVRLRTLPDDCDLAEADDLARQAWVAAWAVQEAARAGDPAAGAAWAAAEVAWAAAAPAVAEAEQRIHYEALAPLVLAALRERGVK